MVAMAAVWAGAIGCGSSSPSTSGGSGGASATGGSSATATGGVNGSGGASATGGVTASGGAGPAGGRSGASGGASVATGGASGPGGGGMTGAAGGSAGRGAGSGGVNGSGGTVGGGGRSGGSPNGGRSGTAGASGGTAGSGGATGAGGGAALPDGDEFDGTSLSASWSVFRPDLADIVVGGGTLSITPHGNALWYQSSQAELVYKLVTGDFKATLTAHARRASDPTKTPTQFADVGGIMARNPTGTSQNYVLGVVGYAEHDQLAVEHKSTTNNARV